MTIAGAVQRATDARRRFLAQVHTRERLHRPNTGEKQ